MTAPYVRQFDEFAADGGATPDWLRSVRRGAIERFAQTGFPGPRDEEWRFTPVAPIVHAEFERPTAEHQVPAAELAPFLFGHPEWPMLVFVDGRFSRPLSNLAPLNGGACIGSLGDALADPDEALIRHLGHHAAVGDSPFTALNTAFIQDGAYVHVPAGVELPHPVHLLFVASGGVGQTVTHPRNLILVDAAAHVSVVESYVSLKADATYFTNAVTEVVSGQGAWTEHTRIQRESEQAYHVGLTHVDQARDSHYRSFTLAMGGAIARHNQHVRLNGPHIETLLYGLYLSRGEQLVDNHTAIYHDHPDCNSWEVYKGVLDGRSRAVFNGKVLVRPEAQKTDAKQTNRNLLLSDGARVHTKPQLEIFADDVKCTHGATVGRLDDVALFYLRSRGIGEADARTLLTYAFAAEVVEQVTAEPVRRGLERLIRERLGAGE